MINYLKQVVEYDDQELNIQEINLLIFIIDNYLFKFSSPNENKILLAKMKGAYEDATKLARTELKSSDPIILGLA